MPLLILLPDDLLLSSLLWNPCPFSKPAEKSKYAEEEMAESEAKRLKPLPPLKALGSTCIVELICPLKAYEELVPCSPYCAEQAASNDCLCGVTIGE